MTFATLCYSSDSHSRRNGEPSWVLKESKFHLQSIFHLQDNLSILDNFTELLMQRNARRFDKQHPDVKCFGRAVFRFLDMQKCRNAGRVKCWKTCQNRKTCHNDTGTKQQNSHVVA